MTLLTSKTHTEGDTRRWKICYGRWLENTATLDTASVTSSSDSCTIGTHSVLGSDVLFFLTGGTQGENLTVTIQITDSFGNVKTDTISFYVVAP